MNTLQELIAAFCSASQFSHAGHLPALKRQQKSSETAKKKQLNSKKSQESKIWIPKRRKNWKWRKFGQLAMTILVMVGGFNPS